MNKFYTTFLILLSAIFFMANNLIAQEESFNYDESKVPSYTLPEILVMPDATPVKTVEDWEQRRRPEVLQLFAENEYGKMPGKPENMHFKVRERSKKAMNGKAIRKQVTVYFNKGRKGPKMDILIYLPAEANNPVPVFLGLNFYGNQTIHDDPAIFINTNWVGNNEDFGIADSRAGEASRGVRKSRWPVEMILDRGYGLATIYCGDLDPDFDDGFQNGVHPLFYQSGQTEPAPDEWGTIGAWAWGLSRTMDYFETDRDIDPSKVAVMGHSRLGKAALWAGASDQRFAMIISNESGCGGAALSRRRYGETIKRINEQFPHWFCDNFNQFNDNEDEMPFDQHMLIALMAPRPVYVASAEGDRWADPKGEFLSAKLAGEVYNLYDLEGVPVGNMPDVSQPAVGRVGYHIRPGNHDVEKYDWEQFLIFANKWFGE